MMRGLCHICYCSGIETFFSKKDGMTVCANCAANEYILKKEKRNEK